VADPRYLLDSNICIYVLEGRPASVRVKLEQFEPGEVVTSAIAYAEVMRGLEHRSALDRRAAERLFKLITPLAFGEAEAREYARLPFRRAAFDRLIAAHARALGLCLVTNNQRHFDDVENLRIDNWTR
jgi:tRNA(fMet)-specific endonuclease VapC